MKKSRICIGEVFTFKIVIMKIAMLVGIILAFQSVASAAPITYEGSFDLDNTTSIVGTDKHDRFYFRLTLEGSSVDLDHSSIGHSDGSTTSYGRYADAVTGFEMMRDPTNTGSWAPSTLVYDMAASTLLTTDVNPSPSDDPLYLMNEHLTVSIGVETANSPLHRIFLNLYNSTFYEPNATRPLWLDTSTPTNGFTLDDLFLKDMDTLSEFKSIKPWEGKTLVDSVWLDGGVDSDFPYRATWGSGTIQSLAAVPIPAAAFMFAPALLGFMGLRRRAKNKA